MEADTQRRSESRTDGSAASCSRAEKRPLNNNILINAPLPDFCGQWLKQMKRLLKAGKTCKRAGPLLAPANRATFHRLLPLCWWEGFGCEH